MKFLYLLQPSQPCRRFFDFYEQWFSVFLFLNLFTDMLEYSEVGAIISEFGRIF